MKDSLGGSMLFNLVIIFVSLIIIFFISILSYSKAYKIKNRIIEIIEKNGVYEEIVADEVNPDLKAAGYDVSKPDKCAKIRTQLIESAKGKFYEIYQSKISEKNLNVYGYNYCVFEVCEARNDKGTCNEKFGKHYIVVTFVRFEFPIIDDVLTFPVYGETKILGKTYDY